MKTVGDVRLLTAWLRHRFARRADAPELEREPEREARPGEVSADPWARPWRHPLDGHGVVSGARDD